MRRQRDAFRTSHAMAPAGYAPDAWVAADREVKVALAAAGGNLAAGRSHDAHRGFERVRAAQCRLRWGASVPYFIDDLTALHTAMGKLAELKAAFAAGDRAKAIEKSLATEPAFSKLYPMFGDFAAVVGS